MHFTYDYTRLLVSDFKTCFRFYRDNLGFEVSYGTEDGTYADLKTGPVTLALFDRHEMSKVVGTSGLPAQADAQDRVCIIFSVANVDETCRQLKQKGIAIIVEPEDRPGWGIRTAHLRDPDGNLIEINQPLPGNS